MKKLNLFFVFILALVFMQSCTKDNTTTPNENRDAPTLPPLESFVMPFEGYEDIDTTGLMEKNGNRSVTYRNWFYAGTNLLVWQVAIGTNMLVPVASFGEAFNHDAEYLGNGLFAWNYNVDVGLDRYNATLTARLVNNNEDVEWKMKISKVGGFSDFEYYSGITAVGGGQATWILNHQPNNPESLLRIEYNKAANSNDATLRYTNIRPNHPDNGDYIEYRVETNGTFNRSYDVSLDPNNFLEIQWNEPSRDGRVRNPGHFNDSEWHCWDSNQMDINCQ